MFTGIETGKSGILAKIICTAGSTANVGDTIAIFVESEEQYMSFFAEQMETAQSEASIKEVKASEIKADAKTILREIRHLITDGKIEDGSGMILSKHVYSKYMINFTFLFSEFAKKLTSLARHGDHEIISAFQASYEGEFFNPLTFDVEFFIQNAKDIIAERSADADKKHMDK